jgi:hypothetical protein
MIATPACLAAAHRMITRVPDCLRRKLGVPAFEFLKAYDVGLRFAEPVQQVRQATVDVVDIETSDLHQFRRERSPRLLEKNLLFSVETCPPQGSPQT